ncbi:hypothetical protein HZF05_07725 [Sphingomonas sp. CGMCC 1.13654]|uniref:Uncharacterized protein n=1 Tax=Sphingomonas chungangi TaxID=2683589 RepID=A0A838L4P9_9SPHN|nr:hypothetical protein [Sphingomonas chungangi]MBA2933987.1 hypothetical protein [Sphingomonas chungangi]MVW57733.1 hypothetical protein [Sphingomonas chungangi]
MARVSEDDPNARFIVEVWERKPIAFTTLSEAREEFERLKGGGRFDFGEISEWVGEPDEWKEVDSFNVYEDEE